MALCKYCKDDIIRSIQDHIVFVTNLSQGDRAVTQYAHLECYTAEIISNVPEEIKKVSKHIEIL